MMLSEMAQQVVAAPQHASPTASPMRCEARATYDAYLAAGRNVIDTTMCILMALKRFLPCRITKIL
jgi:hypothetical protein